MGTSKQRHSGITLVLAATFLLFSTLLNAESKNQGVIPYDVMGITLGMKPAEAVGKFIEVSGVPRDSILFHDPSRVVENQGAYPYFMLTAHDFEISVDLSASIVSDGQTPPVVSRVFLLMPGTPENQEAILSQSIEKYGEPTLANTFDLDVFFAAWCSLPEDQPKASCDDSTGPKFTINRLFNSRSIEIIMSD